MTVSDVLTGLARAAYLRALEQRHRSDTHETRVDESQARWKLFSTFDDRTKAAITARFLDLRAAQHPNPYTTLFEEYVELTK